MPWQLLPLLLAAIFLIGFIAVISHQIKRFRQRLQSEIAQEMQRLMRVYVTEGYWSPQKDLVGRQAAKTLKSRLIIK